jgi:hypothetical protein
LHRLAARPPRRRTGFGRAFVASGTGATFAISTLAISAFAVTRSALAARPVALRIVAALSARSAIAPALFPAVTQFAPERLHEFARSADLLRVQFAIVVGIELLHDGPAAVGASRRRPRRTVFLRSGNRRQQGRQHKAGGQPK